jgi:VanZ family protein
VQKLSTWIKTALFFCQQRPKIWIAAWIIWFVSLWFLSSGNPAPKDLPAIPHLDKIAHFGFFFGGAGLFCAWLQHSFPKLTSIQSLWITTLIGAIVGIIDEYHQSFTPGRTGNDVGDWIADLLGSAAGALIMLWVLSRFKHSQVSTTTNLTH